MEDYKKFNQQTYDSYAEKFDEKFTRHFNSNVIRHAEKFIENLQGKQIVDLGSGPGSHAEYFKSRGLDVLCVDISDKMLEICRQKELRTLNMDIEELSLPQQYDGIWAYASLLHVKRKNISAVFDKIKGYLKPGGVLALAVKEGDAEGYETNDKYPDTKRWFSYYTYDEIMRLSKPEFELLHFFRTPGEKYTFIDFIFKKKS
jgi:SAM-dependent methyltransferase